MSENLESVTILGVKVTISPEDKILEYITKRLEKGDKKIFITTPNPEMIVRAHHDPHFKMILNEADIALPDGVGLVVASKLLDKANMKRIAGVDFMKRVCEKASESADSIALLGGLGGVAEATAECLQKRYPNINVTYAQNSWNMAELKKKKSDILFVALGAPRQEIWIHKNLARLPVRLAMGVGGSFDFISGRVSRAPRLIQHFGLEWLYRLVRQPWRARRQLALIEFIFLVLKEKFKLQF